MFWLYGFLIVAMIFVVINYTGLAIENHKMKKSFSPAKGRYWVMIKDRDSKSVQSAYDFLLVMMHNIHNEPVTIKKEQGYEFIQFKDGTSVLLYLYGAGEIMRFQRDIMEEYAIRVLIDASLPQEALADCVRKLGLENYLVQVCVCSQEVGNEL